MKGIYSTGSELIIAYHKEKHFVQLCDLIRLEASDSYTVIYTVNRRSWVFETVLRLFAERLIGKGFIRVHRSHIVNRDYVVRMDDPGIVVLFDQTRIGVSRRRKKEVAKEVSRIVDVGAI